MQPSEVADGVFFVEGPDVNWVILRDGDDLTLVDAGYPRQVDVVEASIRALGARPEAVRAVLVTHAHVDHIGAIAHFRQAYGTPAYFDPVEVAHARRERLEQASRLDVVRNLWRPGVLPWMLRVVRAGATEHVAVPYARPFPGVGALDLPGRPVPVATHGHTSGHTAFHLPQAGVVITGDGLVTGHAISRRRGPQLIAGFFNHGDAHAALAPLEGLAADVVLPGHGPVHRGPIADAVAQARGTGIRPGA